MSFLKLDSGIFDSSLWPEPCYVRILFITMGLACDRDGYIRMTVQGLARKACISLDEAREGLAKLEAPDPDSRSKTHEGARVVRLEDGWYVVNHGLYRMKDHTGAMRQAAFREKKRLKEEATEHLRPQPLLSPEKPLLSPESNGATVTFPDLSRKRSVSLSVSVSGDGKEGGGGGGEEEAGGSPRVRPEGSEVNPLVGETRGLLNDRARRLIAEISERYTMDQADVWKRVCRWRTRNGRPNFVSRIENVNDDRMLHVVDELESWAAKDRKTQAPEEDVIPVQPMAARLWEGVAKEMKTRFEAHTWTMWFAPCFGRRLINKSLEVVVPNETFRQWMVETHGEACSQVAERPVVFVVGKWVD